LNWCLYIHNEQIPLGIGTVISWIPSTGVVIKRERGGGVVRKEEERKGGVVSKARKKEIFLYVEPPKTYFLI